MQSNRLLKNVATVSAFALPLSASQILNMIANFFSMFMIAKIGRMELAAAALAVTTFITVTMVLSVFYSVGILISHSRGQEKSFQEMGEVVKNGLWMAMTLGIPFSVILWHVYHVLIWVGQDPQLVKLTVGYFHFAAFAIFPMLINTVVGQFFTAIGFPRYNLIVSLLCLPFTLLFAYAFILGNFGCAQHGLAGVTAAILIVQSMVSLLVLAYLLLNQETAKYKIFSTGFLPDWALCKKIFSLGFPIGAQFGAELAAMTTNTYLMGHFGVIALAASQVVSQYSMLVVMVSLGLSQAVSMLVSEAYGKKDYELIRQYIIAALIILSCVFFVVVCFFLTIPDYLVRFFLSAKDAKNRQLVHLAYSFLMIVGFTLFADGIRNILSASLRGMHDSRAPMNIGILCIWFISLPASCLFGFILQGGPIGLRMGFMVGFFTASIWLWYRIRKKLVLFDVSEPLALNLS